MRVCLMLARQLLAQFERRLFARNPIILNFASLISLFTQPIKFCDGQLVLSLAPLSPLCFLSGSITDAYLSNGAFEEPPGCLQDLGHDAGH